MKIIMRRRE